MSEILCKQLIPGIPDEIIIEKVSSKLPRKTFHVLSSVSRRWREAIRAHQFYDARLRAHSAETFVVHIHRHGKIDFIALYSPSEDRCYKLPGIPQHGDRIPWFCRFISLDGKIYVIGGYRHVIKLEQPELYGVSPEVFVLDVAGLRKWEQCTSMQEPRHQFGCGIIDGKIYVFGGMGKSDFPISDSEVYDPKIDNWYSVMPMPSLRFNHKIGTIGEELYAYGGDFYDPELYASNDRHPLTVECHAGLELYHPTKNEWRVVKPFAKQGMELLVVAKGKLHSIQNGCIDSYDMDKKSWTNRSTDSFVGQRPRTRVSISCSASIAVNDELFVRALFWSGIKRGGARLIRSKGFSTENEEITWKTTRCRCSSEQRVPPVMCTILL